jgi:hypothetical protein
MTKESSSVLVNKFISLPGILKLNCNGEKQWEFFIHFPLCWKREKLSSTNVNFFEKPFGAKTFFIEIHSSDLNSHSFRQQYAIDFVFKISDEKEDDRRKKERIERCIGPQTSISKNKMLMHILFFTDQFWRRLRTK